jgi:peptidoglycan/LPS O-acetylase OafA/YrhL
MVTSGGLYVYHDFAIRITPHLLAGRHSLFPGQMFIMNASLIQGCFSLVLTILLAEVSYRYLETRFLKMRSREVRSDIVCSPAFPETPAVVSM